VETSDWPLLETNGDRRNDEIGKQVTYFLEGSASQRKGVGALLGRMFAPRWYTNVNKSFVQWESVRKKPKGTLRFHWERGSQEGESPTGGSKHRGGLLLKLPKSSMNDGGGFVRS